MIIPSKRKVGLVCDAAAPTNGICLNDTLLKGPDLNNNLRAVLLRFRMKPLAFTADIQNMFHQFYVLEKDRTYLRFFWFKDNDHRKPLIEFWSCVHLQGLTGSPAIADVGRRYALKTNPPIDLHKWLHEEYLHPQEHTNSNNNDSGDDKILARQFYVDDILASGENPERIAHLLGQGRFNLQRYNLKLCQINSNSPEVRNQFPESLPLPAIVNFLPNDSSFLEEKEDKTDSAIGEEEESEHAPSHSLGLQWDTTKDDLSVKSVTRDKDFTKRLG